MEPASTLCCVTEGTSSVTEKQEVQYLNLTNYRNERETLNKLLINRHSGRPCSCFSVLSNPKAILCVYCQRQLLRIKTFRNDIHL